MFLMLVIYILQFFLDFSQNMMPATAAASVTAQNVVLQEPLAASTKVLVGSKNINKNVCIDNVDMGMHEEPVLQNSAVNADNNVDMEVQEEPVVQNSAVNAERVEQISGPVEGTANGWVSSSGGDGDFVLLQGHEVNSE